MKRFAAFLIASVLLVSILPVRADALINDNYISFEEYSEAIEAEYAKYGIEGGVYEPEGEFICTYEDLEASLVIIRNYIESRHMEQTEIESLENNSCSVSPITPTAMPVTVTMTDLYTYVSGGPIPGLPIVPNYCTIATTVDIVVDVQNLTIISVSNPILEVTQGFGIADWIEYVSHSTVINQSNKSVTMNITCKIKNELNVGPVTSWEKETITYKACFDNIPYV